MRKYMRNMAIRSQAVAHLKSIESWKIKFGLLLNTNGRLISCVPRWYVGSSLVNTILDICSKWSTAEVSSGQLKMSEADLILKSMNTHQVLVIIVDTRFLGYSTDSLQKHYLASIGTSESVRLPGCESEYIFLGDHMDRCRSSWSLWWWWEEAVVCRERLGLGDCDDGL